MSMRRYTAIESIDRISAFSKPARCKAAPVLPTAVGPATNQQRFRRSAGTDIIPVKSTASLSRVTFLSICRHRKRNGSGHGCGFCKDSSNSSQLSISEFCEDRQRQHFAGRFFALRKIARLIAQMLEAFLQVQRNRIIHGTANTLAAHVVHHIVSHSAANSECELVEDVSLVRSGHGRFDAA